MTTAMTSAMMAIVRVFIGPPMGVMEPGTKMGFVPLVLIPSQ